MIIVAVVALALVVLLAWRGARRKRERGMAADVMSDVLGTTGAYRGGRWQVGDRPWL